jgi:sugar phosphate isomerase/epimerase
MMPNQKSASDYSRRQFVKTLGAASVGLAAAMPAFGAESASAATKTRLGFDNFSLRAMGWKAPQLLDYAAAQKLDVMFFSDLDVFESLEEAKLKDLRKKAEDLGLQIHVGGWSICPTSKAFRNNRGTASEHLSLLIHTARALGSPVARCVLGTREDRQSEGGIEARIRDTVQVLKAARTQALDAGVKIAIENHAGDMQGWELVNLIEEAGRDFVGATMDCGNATWTLEEPMRNLEVLGPYAVTTGLRDSAVWDSPDGAMVQWTAIGEGQMDFKAYARRFAQLCPQTPFVLEIISGFAVSFPYLKDEFWKAFPKAKAADLAAFVAMARRGTKREPYKAPEGVDRKIAEQNYQKAELERSIKYCREVLGLGCKA